VVQNEILNLEEIKNYEQRILKLKDILQNHDLEITDSFKNEHEAGPLKFWKENRWPLHEMLKTRY
jgi:hypothetical protein